MKLAKLPQLQLMKLKLSLNSSKITKKFQKEKEEVNQKFLHQLESELITRNISSLDIIEKIQKTQQEVLSILRE